MTSVQLRVDIDEAELSDATSDIQQLLALDRELLDLSPSFRRVLFDLEDAFVEVFLQAAAARERSRDLRQESRAVRAQAGHAVAKATQTLSRLIGRRRLAHL